MSSLDATLLYMLATVLGVALFRSLRLPVMPSYLLVGVLIGPHTLGLVKDTDEVRHLAEFGVVFLMFVIGLEFSLSRLRQMRKMVFGLGLGQVTLTIAGSVVVNFLLALLFAWLGKHWDLSWQGAVAMGSILAMSSTAIVARLMAERLELQSEHGQRVIGVLLFQDLAVVPLLFLIPALAQSEKESVFWLLGLGILKGVVVVTLLLWSGGRVIGKWLTAVARRKSEELFVLNLLLITVGMAWLTEVFGLSLALGAFLAGMLISETEYRLRVETDIRPFHDVLLGLFFITIGMKLNPHVVFTDWHLVLLLSFFPLLCKALLIAGLAWFLGASSGASLRTALYLAQVGEFGIVLLSLSVNHGLIATQWLSPLLASMVLSMLATPFLIQYSERWVFKLLSNDWMRQSVQLTHIAQQSMHRAAHVILCGYGRSGQQLAGLLDQEGVPYMALDLDPDRVRQASATGQSVVIGDAARLSSLMAAGLARAAVVVITYRDTNSSIHVLNLVLKHAPQVPVVVRTHDEHGVKQLRAAGAMAVVAEATEGSLMLAGHALALMGLSMRRVLRVLESHREARYEVLRGPLESRSTAVPENDSDAERLTSFLLPLGAAALGQPLSLLALDEQNVRLLLLRRASGLYIAPSSELVLESGDTLFLVGATDTVTKVMDRLTKG